MCCTTEIDEIMEIDKIMEWGHLFFFFLMRLQFGEKNG